MALTNVYLHGRLGKLYGHEWKLAVRSPAEAIRAIDVNVKGRLKEQLYKEGTKKFYKICLGNPDNALEKAEVGNPSGNVDIHIVPVPRGKKSGVGKVLAAIVIAVLTYYTFGAGAKAGVGLFGMTAGETASIGYGLAASLALGGITQMLTPVPNFNQGSDDDGRGSNLFQGNSVVTTQGSTVGLVYGRMMVTPMPVSVSFSNYDDPSTNMDFGYTSYVPKKDANGVITMVPSYVGPGGGGGQRSNDINIDIQ